MWCGLQSAASVRWAGGNALSNKIDVGGNILQSFRQPIARRNMCTWYWPSRRRRWRRRDCRGVLPGRRALSGRARRASGSRFHLTRRWWSVPSQTDMRRVAAPIRRQVRGARIHQRRLRPTPGVVSPAPGGGKGGGGAGGDSNWPRSTGNRPPG